MRAIGAGLLAIILSASGCRYGDAWGAMNPVHRAVARQDVAKGCELSAKGNDEAARSAFENAATHDPHNAAAHANLGRIHAAAGRYDDAVREYQLAVRNAPDSSEYALALANCLDATADTSLDRQRTLAAAARAYRHVRGLDPHNLEAAIRLGACCRRQGDLAEAVTVLREAEQIDSASKRVHLELALVYHDAGDLAKALNEYSAALKLDPSDLAAHNGCGEINLVLSRRDQQGHPLARQKAVAHLRKSLELEAAQPRIRALLAQIEPSASEMADADKAE